jgi:hypothetical protein
VRPEGLGKFKKSPHRVSNPRPSGFDVRIVWLIDLGPLAVIDYNSQSTAVSDSHSLQFTT